jgi:hypothetical protein
MPQLPESERPRLGAGQSPISLSVTECLHRVGRAIYGDAWIAGLTPIERARMIQYPRGAPLPNDPELRAEIERIQDRDELARVQRGQARIWIGGSGFNTGPGTFNDQEAFERALARDYPAQAAPEKRAGVKAPNDGRRRIPLSKAMETLGARLHITAEEAWRCHLRADVVDSEIEVQCRAMRRDEQRGQWINVVRALDPRWLAFVAYECPHDNHLRFDLSAAIRARMAGENVDPPPEHARDICVDAARLDELYPLPVPEPTATAETTPCRVQIATKRDKLSSWIAEQYPQGIPAGTTAKAIAQEFRGATNISVGERTVRRALGRK